jgi:transposase
MPLAIRLFVCEACEFVCDRDHNAALNLDRGGQPRIKRSRSGTAHEEARTDKSVANSLNLAGL